jgi:hypothetical protein
MSKDDTIAPGWKTAASNAYSPSKFYTGSKDDQGHSTLFHIKAPDYLVPRLQALVATVPQYKTSHDIFRDGLRHRIEWLEENLEAVTSDPEWQIYAAIEQADAYAAKVRTFSELPGKIRDLCRSLKAAGAIDALTDYLNTMTLAAFNYPEPWRSMVLDELSRHK